MEPMSETEAVLLADSVPYGDTDEAIRVALLIIEHGQWSKRGVPDILFRAVPESSHVELNSAITKALEK